MNPKTQDIVLTCWLRWSEGLAEESGVPTAETAICLFCEHLESMHSALLAEIEAPARQKIKAWIAEDYLP